MSLLARFPLVGPFWSYVAEQRAVEFTLVMLCVFTGLVMGVLWLREYGASQFVWIRCPFCGFSPSQVRAGLTLALPLTFHLSPLIFAFMLLFHVGRAAHHLGRVLVGAETDL